MVLAPFLSCDPKAWDKGKGCRQEGTRPQQLIFSPPGNKADDIPRKGLHDSAEEQVSGELEPDSFPCLDLFMLLPLPEALGMEEEQWPKGRV